MRTSHSFVLLAAAGMAMLTACGNDSPPDTPRVASVQTGSASAPVSSTVAPSTEVGIQQRLDDSREKVNEYIIAYSNCLHDAGAGGTWIETAKYWKLDYTDPAKVTPEQLKACETKRPIPPPELDPVKNPHYAEDLQERAQCMRDRGIEIVMQPDGWFLLKKPDANGYKIAQECLIEAFGK